MTPASDPARSTDAGGRDPRLDVVERLTAAFATELEDRRGDEPVPSTQLPDATALVRHLGGVHRWVARLVRSGTAVRYEPLPPAPFAELRDGFARARRELAETLAEVPADQPCWIVGGSVGDAAFWRRRMVYENVKHLMDLRASGRDRFEVAPELAPADYADGVDELFAVHLPQSRSGLARLPGPILLEAADVRRSWRVESDWEVREPREDAGADDAEPGAVRVRAHAGALALSVWERADPLTDDRFEVTGDRAALAAFRAAVIHPWR